jgi:hypothetical protein
VWLGKRQQAAVEPELTSMEGATKSGDELAAEDTAERADGKEEGTCSPMQIFSPQVHSL